MTFQYCENAKGDLIIPANIQKIGYWAFNHYGDDYFKNRGTLRINANLDTIPHGAFSSRHFTGNLVIPESVVYIGETAFEGNFFTGDLIIPDKVEVIGERAFSYRLEAGRDSYFDNLILGTNLVFIDKYAFAHLYQGPAIGSTPYYVGHSFDKIKIKRTNANNFSFDRYAFGEPPSGMKQYDFEVPIGTSSIYQEILKWHIKSITEINF